MQIEEGDIVIEVDGVRVTADNAPDVLRGSDEIGSLVDIKIEKGQPGAPNRESGKFKRNSWNKEHLPNTIIRVSIVRSAMARIKPLSEMVLAMAKAADPKNTSPSTAAEIHKIKGLTDAYVAVETQFFEQNEARVRDLEALATVESDVCQRFMCAKDALIKELREKLRLLARAREREKEEAENAQKNANMQLEALQRE